METIDQIRSDISLEHTYTGLQSENVSSFSKFEMINMETLYRILAEMNKNFSKFDTIPNSALTKCQTKLFPHLLLIKNLSFNRDPFLVTVKQATFVPIVKNVNGGSKDFKNYRPVSNTSFLGIVVEKVALKHFNAHLEVNKLFGHSQLGF